MGTNFILNKYFSNHSKLYCILILLGLSAIIQATNHFANDIHSQWKLKQVTVDQGLSNNYVHSICQDKDGYIWFATSYGLNRYNGISVEKFFNDKTHHGSLNSNYISCLYLDTDSVLWIGTDRGLQIYNDTLEIFEDVKIPDGVESREIYCITQDKNRNLLIGAPTGLFSYNLSEKSFQEITFEDQKVKNDSVYRMVVDEDNNVWFTRFQRGLYYYNRATNEIKEFRAQPNEVKALSEDWISGLYIDHSGELWIGTYNSGLCKFNPDDSSFTRYVIDPDNVFTMRIRTMFEDRFGRMFLGSREGLYLFDKETGKSSLYALKSHKVSQLSQNSVICTFLDNQGGVWIGTHSGGINYLDMYEKEFAHYSYIQGDNHFLNTGAVHCFAETAKKLYVGTEKGISVLNKETGTFKYLMNIPGDNTSLSYNDVKQITVETDDRVWVATNRGGIQVLNADDKVIETYRHDPLNSATIPSDNVYNIFLDNSKTLWVITNRDWDREKSVLSRYDKKTNSFKSYPRDLFMGIYEAPDSTLLFGGYYGFYKYNKEKDTLIEFKNDSLVFRTVVVYQDNAKNIWMGGRSGLCRYNAVKGVFEDIQKNVGVKFEEVYGMLERNGNLWVSTNNGLLEIQNIYSNTNSFAYRSFDKNDGLQSREFNYNAYFKSSDGSFYFGGDNGFNRFFPDEIQKNQYLPQVRISSLTIAGKRIYPNDTVNNNICLNTSIKYADKIKLKYNSGAIKLRFDAIHYANAQANTYKYKLVGQDENWSYANAYNNYVTYHKLSPGNYTFMVYALNADDIQSKEPATINIDILPPFWQTIGFKVSLIVALILWFFVIIHLRTRYLRKQSDLLKAKVKEKTGQLAVSYELLKERQEEITAQRDTINEKNVQLEEQNEVLEDHRFHLEEIVAKRTRALEQEKIKAVESDRLKSAFLANMSHEIRTPLNAIIGFSNILYNQNTDVDQRYYFEIIKKSGFTLLKLIEDIIDFSRIESGTVEIQTELVMIDEVLNNQYKRFELEINESNKEHSQKVELILDNHINVSSRTLHTDPVRLDQILSNLISNAIKFTHQGYVKYGLLEVKDQMLTFYVEDTGIGIEKDDFDKIFKRFRKLEHKTQKLYRGGGLGLSITKSLVNLLGGNIYIESELNKGTTLYFTIKDMVDDQSEVVQTQVEKPKTEETLNWKDNTVLIVEDEVTNFKLLEAILSKTKINILYASDGFEAIELFKKNIQIIDVVLMDIKLPQKNGIEVCKEIKKLKEDLPIIAQTAYATESDKKEIRQSEMDDFITKPIKEKLLMEKMCKYLKGSLS